ncbi:MAG: RNA 2',3'-cyclic phosphodiesterase [Betaproteobacteria bacterium]|nr:MAG: RNA 2',3'-cyclic phosphodiesterase [Betaproteobacteria bacterium]
MRLFFALWPDAGVREMLARWAEACNASVRGRATRTENLHATLAFLGEIAPQKLASLCTLGAEIQGSAFELTFDRLEYWPHNRIVYAGCSQAPAALGVLAEDLRARLGDDGYAVDSRPYVAHVTLVRDARRAPKGVLVEPVLWQVRDIALVESAREDGTLVYRPIRRFTLST